jgi:hypothetical protein
MEAKNEETKKKVTSLCPFRVKVYPKDKWKQKMKKVTFVCPLE